MIIYGASGHAKVIIDIILSKDNGEISYIFDDNKEITRLLDFKVTHEWTDEMNKYESIIAIGDNWIRKKVSQKIKSPFSNALIHKSAEVSENAKIGNGTAVMPGAIINSSAQIGAHCIVNSLAIIEHDSKIADFAHISPGATVTGNVEIGEGTQVGAGATIIPGIKIGNWVSIGAGAIIINDIPDFAVVVGNPGRIIKFNKLENE